MEGFDAGGHRGVVDSLHSAVKVFPTPNARDWRSGVSGQHGTHSPNLPEFLLGKLNPEWVESLMGFPEGWTALPVTLGPADPPTRKRPGKRRAPSPAPSPIERPD
jgi:hypothetical protein